MKKWIPRSLLAALIVYAVLLTPDPEPKVALDDLQGGSKRVFAWNQDEFWTELEKQYVASKDAGCEETRRSADSLMVLARRAIAYIRDNRLEPGNPIFRQLENLIFGIGSLAAPCPERVSTFKEIVEESRKAVKRQSEQWDVSKEESRETLYRLLYGSRGAMEEVLLHVPVNS